MPALVRLADRFRTILAGPGNSPLIHPADKALLACAESVQTAIAEWKQVTDRQQQRFDLQSRLDAVSYHPMNWLASETSELAQGSHRSQIDAKLFLGNARAKLDETRGQIERQVDDGF